MQNKRTGEDTQLTHDRCGVRHGDGVAIPRQKSACDSTVGPLHLKIQPTMDHVVLQHTFIEKVCV